MKLTDRLTLMNRHKGDTHLGNTVRKLLIVQALSEVNEERYGDLSYRCETLLIKQKRGLVTHEEFLREALPMLQEYGDPNGIGL